MVGNFLVFQWTELGVFTAGAWVQSLVGELTSNKLHATAKKKKEKVKARLFIRFDDKEESTNERMCGGIYIFSTEG